ncbi:MAG TPA: hypothetical protein DCL39_17280 [Alteromonas macleodii]|uniref:hypothetical protein n=1 Tax=unclassified Alteromonas TaxID=2614992 RepID=UPI000BCF2E26|nr:MULTISPECIES: hypothetical protein [Alteromonas]MCG7637462.1 hypothetical protein [Alteromonas sp. CNT1-28]MCG7813413.1 hypothetical protein [Alteromonas sp. MCA-1]OZC00650.1 hypothetical protein BBP29_10930 [Alteromonas macleodii]HAG31217.1 hypothetical protein [Alteromonas macleodii]HAM19682.1 hypothetical protein [Alteromonas macleodii]|tara:strand:+ start:2799 stop:3011 length:213 start_codon:yes stop_codon:yes gene_type:complete
MKALKELLAIAQDASKQRDTDIIAQFKADHADELSQEKEKMWCLLMPEDEEQDAPGDAQESEEKNQVSLH